MSEVGMISGMNCVTDDMNWVQMTWDADAGTWNINNWLGNTTVDQYDYFILVHGRWQNGGTTVAPIPSVTHSDMVWSF